jgi:Kef-type K+ transport system membrane component KefB
VILGISVLADVGNMQAVFGAFLLGLVFANRLSNHAYVLSKLRSTTVSILVPVFFSRASMLIYDVLSAATQNVALITGILLLKVISKHAGTYYLSRLWIPEASLFSVALLSTSMIIGILKATFGRDSGFMD